MKVLRNARNRARGSIRAYAVIENWNSYKYAQASSFFLLPLLQALTRKPIFWESKPFSRTKVRIFKCRLVVVISDLIDWLMDLDLSRNA
ncbi:unnamed protein product [Microthlaspi erraticum]|uniref:Uncharacterized protein n=1 Tax=Microthlaspi erraticum TaxID=1685480 RepID=A0A6D2JRI4_9BRAS|nr:unnamed protein product [Microthlaspi erraticum]